MPGDRRSRHLRLTAKGENVRATALAAGDQLERQRREAIGPSALAGLRAGLLALVSTTGDLDDVLARRARIIW
jgi:DNA-binding MarR family transcriptional regulator